MGLLVEAAIRPDAKHATIKKPKQHSFRLCRLLPLWMVVLLLEIYSHPNLRESLEEIALRAVPRANRFAHSLSNIPVTKRWHDALVPFLRYAYAFAVSLFPSASTHTGFFQMGTLVLISRRYQRQRSKPSALCLVFTRITILGSQADTNPSRC